MLTIYGGNEGSIGEIDEIVPGSWVHVVAPDKEDLTRLDAAGIPAQLLTHVHDLGERPRAERDEGVVLIVLHFPYEQGATTDIPFITIPLSILLTDTLLVTIVPKATGVLAKFTAQNLRNMSVRKKEHSVLLLLWHLAKEYLLCLDEINRAVNQLEDQLERSLRNREVLGLLKYEKSLVYFTTALRSNEVVLERLQRGQLIKWDPDDREIIEDVLIEVRQAIEQVNISQNILTQMMDAFASIVSNNLNAVMKFLTSVTIVVSLPTLIASVYGMNVALPGAGNPLAFAGIVAASTLISLGVIVVFWKKNWL